MPTGGAGQLARRARERLVRIGGRLGVPTGRGRLAAVWAASAVAAMVALSWWHAGRAGLGSFGGDMVGHAAYASWLRGLPWWDWRGWSDWFYGGQAVGVNYPPLSSAWLRFTDPLHGQFAAVAVGLLILLPIAARSVARALGVKVTGAAWAVLFAVVALGGYSHWLLSGFHSVSTGFGSWPAMIATLLGVICVARAFDLARPISTGVLAGVALLFNATVVPGVIILMVVVLAAGRRGWAALRWAATVGCAALAVCGWWLVPFVHGRDRLVRWHVPLEVAARADRWQEFLVVVVVLLFGVSAVLLGRRGRVLGAGALTVTLAAGVADRLGYLRAERWIAPTLVLLIIAGALGFPLMRIRAGLGPPAADSSQPESRSPRVFWRVAVLAAAVGAVAWFTGIYALAPAVAWLLWRRRLLLVRYAAPAWCALLLVLPAQRFAETAGTAPPPHPSAPIAAASESGGGGFVYAQTHYSHPYGGLGTCPWGDPWADADGLRPLTGLYRETSASAEFINAEEAVRLGGPAGFAPALDDWARAWDDAPTVEPDSRVAAEALGARWLVTCDPEGLSTDELRGRRAGAVRLNVSPSDDAWHKQATRWWAGLLTGRSTLSEADDAVPVTGEADWETYPPHRAATGVVLLEAGESFAVTAESAGWAWARIPWDPYWHAHEATPILKGGPGHLVVWAEPGRNNYGWWVPPAVNAAATILTAAAGASALILAIANRRRSG